MMREESEQETKDVTGSREGHSGGCLWGLGKVARKTYVASHG